MNTTPAQNIDVPYCSPPPRKRIARHLGSLLKPWRHPRLWSLALGAGMLSGGYLTVKFYVSEYLQATDAPPNPYAQALVIETGSDDRILDGVNRWMEALKSNRRQVLLISGINPKYRNGTVSKNHAMEGTVLVEICRKHGMEEQNLEKLKRILSHIRPNQVLVSFAKNTADNAEDINRLSQTYGIKSFEVETSENHIPRSATEIRRFSQDKFSVAFVSPHASSIYDFLDSEILVTYLCKKGLWGRPHNHANDAAYLVPVLPLRPGTVLAAQAAPQPR